MSTAPGRRARLRDVATICPATMRLDGDGLIINRCELDCGHDGRHKGGCTFWPDRLAYYPDTTPATEEPQP